VSATARSRNATEAGQPPREALDLPTRFHIGTQRAGSTFLFNLLKSHPDVSVNPTQAIEFYGARYHQGFEWYLSGFPAEGIRIDTSARLFLYGDVAAPRIKEAVGADAPRFLLVLRNPVDYARSHYEYQLRRGMLERNRDLYPVLPGSFVQFTRRYDEWLSLARYAYLLQNFWFSHFDRSRFKIVLFEDLVAEPDRVCREILDFFGVSARPLGTAPASQNRTMRHPALHVVRRALKRGPPGLRKLLKGSRLLNWVYLNWMVQRTPMLSAGDRAAVAALLADDVAALKKLLGHEIPQWGDFASQRG
jgi:hypothetical protein